MGVPSGLARRDEALVLVIDRISEKIGKTLI